MKFDMSTLFWIFFIVVSLQPLLRKRFLLAMRQRLIGALEKMRGSRVIVLIHRQETMSLLGFPIFRYIDIDDSEEVIRAFLLSRLWKVWPSTMGKLLVVVISACLFGLIHLYQGPVNAAWTAIFGLIVALYYLRLGRLVPLILAHYLTNVLQLVVFAVR